MKKLKLDFGDLRSAELLTREQLKTIQGGVLSGGGGCYRVYSDQGYSSCWYSTDSDGYDLCYRVYGSHCNGTSNGTVDCAANNCTMN